MAKVCRLAKVKRATLWFVLFIAVLTLMATVAPVSADSVNPLLDPVMMQQLTDKVQQEGGVRVIVKLDVPNVATLTEQSRQLTVMEPGQKKRQGAVQADLALKNAIAGSATSVTAGLGASDHRVIHTYNSIPYLALWVNASGLAALQKSPQVLDIVEDVPVGFGDEDEAKAPLADPLVAPVDSPSLSDSTSLIGATEAWAAGYTGEGWYVAIVDTGIRKTHQMFTGKTIVEACFSANNSCPGGGTAEYGPGTAAHYSSTYYGYDHGTHVSGIAAGNNGSLFGVAKDADIIAVQVFSKFNDVNYCGANNPCVLSYNSDSAAGMDYVYTLRNTYRIAAANMSLGGGQYDAACDSDARKAAIDNLKSARIATAIATGNNGYCGYISAPACVSSGVAVGSSTKADAESSFSNWHETMQKVFAPGSSIYSSTGDGDATYESWNGTSMATPHVTGAWALMKSKKANASVDEVLRALVSTGVSITTKCGGAASLPRIQVDAALEKLKKPTGSALPLLLDDQIGSWSKQSDHGRGNSRPLAFGEGVICLGS